MRLYLLSIEAIESDPPLTRRLRWRLPDGTVLTEDVSDIDYDEMTTSPGCPWACDHSGGETCSITLAPGSHYKTLLDYA